MCSLCGILGVGSHWTDRIGDREAGWTPSSRRRERLQRCALANRVLARYRLRLADFEGQSYVLRSATGRSEIVPDLAGMWAAAERLAGGLCDPLDPALIADLEQS